MRLSLLVNILVILAVATTIVGIGLFMGLLSVPGGGSLATTPPPSSGPPPTLNPTPSPEPSASASGVPSATVRPTPGGVHIVQPGETLSTIGDLYGVPWVQIAEANDVAPPYVIHEGDELTIPVPESVCYGYQEYIVQSGDFVIAIANEFGVDPTELADMNLLADWNDIRPGDVLCIPAPGWTPLPTPAE